MIKTAVIIAGGEGSRLRPLTEDKPKTLVDVNGKPILYWIING
jgi:NDP-sugar pyrophosphorylase family protein